MTAAAAFAVVRHASAVAATVAVLPAKNLLRRPCYLSHYLALPVHSKYLPTDYDYVRYLAFQIILLRRSGLVASMTFWFLCIKHTQFFVHLAHVSFRLKVCANLLHCSSELSIIHRMQCLVDRLCFLHFIVKDTFSKVKCTYEKHFCLDVYK